MGAANNDLRGLCLVKGPMDLLALRQWRDSGLGQRGTGFSSATSGHTGQAGTPSNTLNCPESPSGQTALS